MGEDLKYRPNRVIAPLLATAVMLLLGTAFCVAIILAFGEAKPIPVAIAVGVVLLGGITAAGTLIVLRVTGGRRR